MHRHRRRRRRSGAGDLVTALRTARARPYAACSFASRADDDVAFMSNYICEVFST